MNCCASRPTLARDGHSCGILLRTGARGTLCPGFGCPLQSAYSSSHEMACLPLTASVGVVWPAGRLSCTIGTMEQSAIPKYATKTNATHEQNESPRRWRRPHQVGFSLPRLQRNWGRCCRQSAGRARRKDPNPGPRQAAIPWRQTSSLPVSSRLGRRPPQFLPVEKRPHVVPPDTGDIP